MAQRFERATRKYILWLCDPRQDKIGKEAFAASIGYSMATLRRLDKDPEVLAEVQRTIIRTQVLTPDRVKDLMEVLVEKAIGGDMRAMELTLRWIGRVPAWNGRDLHAIATEVPDMDALRKMSDDELQDYLDAFKEKI